MRNEKANKIKFSDGISVGKNSWGTLIDYIYDYFCVNTIYWEVLLVRRERVMRNGTIGPSYNFMDMIGGG